MKKKGILFCVGLLIAFTMVVSDLALAAEPKEIVIGSTLALSGRFKGIVGEFDKLANAWTGMVNDRGGIYVKEYGKKLPIRIQIYDDASKPENARKFYEKMAADPNIAFFLGPFSSFISNAAITVAGKHKIPMQMVCANDAVLFEKMNYWRVGTLLPAEAEWKSLLPVYKAKGGLKTFATITMDTLHNKGATRGFEEGLEENGFKVVYSEIAPPPTKNFAPIIAKMKRANPDAVCIEALSMGFTIGFLKQMREAGFKPKEVILGHVTKHVIDALGPDAENITGLAYYFDGNTQDHKDYNEICKRSGFTWGEFMESSIRYWAYTRVKTAIEKAGTLNRKKIMDTLWDMKIKIMGQDSYVVPTGYGALGTWPCQVKGGEFVSIWPVEKAMKLHKFKNP
jgi:branched-chain amino acid transport system substrate-binding protein